MFKVFQQCHLSFFCDWEAQSGASSAHDSTESCSTMNICPCVHRVLNVTLTFTFSQSVLWWVFHCFAAICLAPLCFSLLPAAISPLPPFSHSHAKVSGRVYLIMNRWVSARFLWHPPPSHFTSDSQLPPPVARRPFPPTLTCPCDYTLMIFWSILLLDVFYWHCVCLQVL